MKAPHTVDLNVNGVCNLNCPWCWGPEHAQGIETFSDEEWIELINYLVEQGTQSFVFTGGEPLLKPSLRRLLKVSFDLGSRNTLSTNGILLKTNQDILDIVHDIGIPIDGSDPEKNQIMRVGTKAHFQKALDALKFVQDQRPHIDLTIRTVAASRNIQDIPNIGRVLIENGIDPKRIRWKIYQCSTSGPRRGKTISDGWLISDEDFQTLQKEVEVANPQFENLKFQPLSRSTKNRYFHVGPNGDLKIVENDIRGLPIENTIGRIGNGNISEQLESIFSQYPDIFIPLSLNDSHG